MDFKEQQMNFQEADRQYAELKRRHEAGEISTEEFDEQRKQLMVEDEQGRWWAKSRVTGGWNYYDGNAWMPGTPPSNRPDSSTTRPGDVLRATGNTSGMGDAAQVPPEIRRWNWGAFLLNWIWGLFNLSTGRAVLTLVLAFVPLVNLIWAFVLGANGSEWSWREKRWESAERFRGTQRKWAWAGIIVFLGSLLLGVVFAVLGALLAATAEPPPDTKTGSPKAESPKAGSAKAGSVQVPDLEGDTISQATRSAGSDFDIVVEYMYARDQPKGTIMDQDPASGTTASSGSDITVDLSGGPNQVRVPDVSGMSASEAGATLIDAGLDPDFDVAFDQNGTPEARGAGTNRISGTDPAAGTLASPDIVITTR